MATADSLINDQRVVLNAMIDEAKLIAAQGDPNREQVIRIEGGMDHLPGTDIIMPERQLNGRQLELTAHPATSHTDPQSHPQDKH